MGGPRFRIALLVGAVAALTLAPSAAASSGTTVVHPTGVFPRDVERVQAAVDAGGLVVLKSTNVVGVPTAFDFGPAGAGGGRVDLTNDVTIVGDDGATPTTITGGVIPFFGRQHTQTRIEGLTFDGPLLSAMIFLRSRGAEIVDNHIVDVVGEELFFGATEGRGIKFLGNSDPGGAITGRVLVEGNVIEGGVADLDEGIVFDAVAADVTIRDNVTRDVAGVLVIAPGGAVEITRNAIAPGSGTGSEFNFGNGLQLLGGASGHDYRVSHNVIDCPNSFADALILAGSDLFGGPLEGVVVEHNDIRVTSDFAAITLFGNVEDAMVANNRVSGRALWALGVIPLFEGERASRVTSLGNNLTGFDATFADTVVFSHATGTRLIGNGGDVFDIGTNTTITGSTSMNGGADIGSRIRDARARVDAVSSGNHG